MTFNTNIPVTGDTLGGTRDIIRTNFQRIAAVEAVNHVAFNSSGEGKHKFMQMPEQASAPTTAANEGALYAKESGSKTCLFWREESDGTEIQITGSLTPSSGTNGYTFLPGGLLMQWGRKANPSDSGSVTFPTPFPSGSRPHTIILTLERDSGNQSVCVDSDIPPTSTGFNYESSSSGSVNLDWIAIGT